MTWSCSRSSWRTSRVCLSEPILCADVPQSYSCRTSRSACGRRHLAERVQISVSDLTHSSVTRFAQSSRSIRRWKRLPTSMSSAPASPSPQASRSPTFTRVLGGASPQRVLTSAVNPNEVTDYFTVESILAMQLDPEQSVTGFSVGCAVATIHFPHALRCLFGLDLVTPGSFVFHRCRSCYKKVEGDACAHCSTPIAATRGSSHFGHRRQPRGRVPPARPLHRPHRLA